MLILPGSPAFAHMTETTFASNPVTPGVNFTCGANNTDGAAVSVLSALAHDVHFLVVGVGNMQATGGNGKTLIDLLVDPAGGSSWSQLISDMLGGFLPGYSASQNAMSYWYAFPLWVKAGSSFGVQGRTAHTADITAGRIIVYAFGHPKNPHVWWCGQKVESLGINAASSQGTNVTPGGSGSYGSWTNIGSTTSGRYGSMCYAVQGSDGTAAAAGYFFEFGAGSTKIGSRIFKSIITSEFGDLNSAAMEWCDVPQGTQMQARGTANIAGPENIDVAIYGVY